MDDDELMSPQQRQLLTAVVEACNRGDNAYSAAVATSPPSTPGDVDAVLRILDLASVGYQLGDSPAVVLGRILDLLEAVAIGEYEAGEIPAADSRD